MAAPKGNQFWLARSSHGRKPIFKSSDELWSACLEYFQWVEEHPLTEEKAFCYQGEITTHNVAKMRAMTIAGLCYFLHISFETWTQYKVREDLSDVVREAEQVIYDQKFSGASADLLNANIIARDLGLKDKVSNEHTGQDGEPIQSHHEWTINIKRAKAPRAKVAKVKKSGTKKGKK